MGFMSRRAFIGTIHVAVALACALPARAQQDFPNRPLKIVVGFGPGVGAEVSTRVLADLVSKELGQSVVVENKPGASSMIAVNQVAQAPKDGYTILMLNIQQYNNYLLFKNVGYKSSDFIPFAGGGILTLVMVTSKTLPVTSAREFVDYARANPGKVNYGYWGTGGSPQLMAIRMEGVSGLKMVGVGYKDPAQASTDLIGGQIQVFFTSATHGLSLMQGGHANILAVGAPRRLVKLPDVPTFIESGIEGMPSPWWGYAVPAGTPAEVVSKLERAFKAAMATPRYQQMLVDSASAPLVADSPAKLSEFIERESERWAAAIRPLNLKLD